MSISELEARTYLELMNYTKLINDQKMFFDNRDRLLIAGNSLFDIIPNYLFLAELGVAPHFQGRKIAKGRKLYRIRKYNSETDFSNPSEWTAPPLEYRQQNRANKVGQEALYLADSEHLCLWETHITKGEKYALATYECQEDIAVGSLSFLDSENINLNLASFVINAFFMAPARKENENVDIFEYLDERFGRVLPCDLKIEDGFLLSYKFGVMNQKHQHYELTNKIADSIATFFPDGIKYSSCYMPLENGGLGCPSNNIVLYNGGISKIKYIEHRIEICDEDSALIPIKKICEEHNGMSEEMIARFYIE